MDALVRSGRAFLIAAAVAAAFVACAGASSGPPVGASDKVRGGKRAQDGGSTALLDGAAALPDDYRTSFTKVNKARLVSQGHAAGRWEIDVWANDAAKNALSTRAREAPVGAIVVQEHFERTEAKTSGPIMVMEKRPPGFAKEHGDWRWAVVGSQGQLVSDGVIAPCAGCHDDAPMDGLFPILE